ncbi:MAG: hypothetical protein R3D05_03170 [Dongiaceae bacterium]
MHRDFDTAERHLVSVEADGKTYSGSYKLSHGVIQVSYGDQSRTTQLSGPSMSPVIQARMLLREMIN